MPPRFNVDETAEVIFFNIETNKVVLRTNAILADIENKNKTVYPIEALRSCSLCYDVGIIHDEEGDLTFCDCMPEEFQNIDLNNVDEHA